MLYVRESDQFVNASQLCLERGKRFGQYLKLKATQDFLEVLSIKLRLPIAELVRQGERGKGKDQATWIHPTVAIHLGQWLGAENSAESIVYLWEQLQAVQLSLAATQSAAKELQSDRDRLASALDLKPHIETAETKSALVFRIQDTCDAALDEQRARAKIKDYKNKRSERLQFNEASYFRTRGGFLIECLEKRYPVETITALFDLLHKTYLQSRKHEDVISNRDVWNHYNDLEDQHLKRARQQMQLSR